MRVKKNFCHRPFTEMHIEENGNITPCCVMPSNIYFVANGIDNYLKSDKLREIKKAFLNNEQHPYCQFCWDAEKNRVHSHRTNDKVNLSFLRKIHLRFNNVCNFKCRICNPKFSSTWTEENKKHKYFEDEYTVEKNIFESTQGIKDLILENRSTLKAINISGGEPLITKLNYAFLNFLIENKLTHIKLEYSTNLSTLDYNGIDLLSLFSKFDSVALSASIDGYGKHVEYSRAGFNWKNFVSNLYKARSYVKSLICVVSIYSVYSIPQLQYFAEKNNFKVSYQPCLYPQFLSAQSLLIKEKLQIVKFYDSVKIAGHLNNYTLIRENVLNYMLRQNLSTYQDIGLDEMNCNKEFKNFNTILDKTREESFTDIFPQFKDWYENINA